MDFKLRLRLGCIKPDRLSLQDSRALHCAASVAVPDPSDDEVLS